MISLTLIGTVIMLFLSWLTIKWYQKNRKLPPGPWGLPVVGYYPFLPENTYVHYAKLAKHYGNVFSFTTVGGKLVVILNGAEAIKEIFVTRAEEFIGRPEEHNLIPWISDGYGITQEEGEAWKEQRRFFLQTAKVFGFGRQETETKMHDEINTLIEHLKSEEGQPSDIRFHVAYAVNCVICPILFSKRFPKYGGNFREIIDGAGYLVEIFQDQRYMLIGPIFEHILMKCCPSTKRIREAKNFFIQVSKEIVHDHVSTFDPNFLRDYVDAYLYEAYKRNEKGEKHSYTIDRLRSICQNLLMEGTESVGGTICKLLDVACQYPEEQNMVQEELDSVVGRERLPSCMDRQNLPYLDAFIQELYRHNMLFNISTHYCNFKETTIRGYRIPRRTLIIANQWSVNNDPTLFPEPSKFNPKRFLDENGKRIKTEGPFTFGLGKRACIGESLAQMEVFLVIAALLQNFTLYPSSQKGYLKVVSRQ